MTKMEYSIEQIWEMFFRMYMAEDGAITEPEILDAPECYKGREQTLEEYVNELRQQDMLKEEFQNMSMEEIKEWMQRQIKSMREDTE